MMFPKMLIGIPPDLRLPSLCVRLEPSARRTGSTPALPGRDRLHYRRTPAVDVNRTAGHIGCSVGGEEGRDGGEFLGPAHAAERHPAPGLGNEVLERNVGALAAMAAHDLVADDDTHMQ